MTIDEDDANFMLDMWTSSESEHDPVSEYALERAPLETRAKELLAAGTYGYLVLYVWNDATDEWDNVAEFGD